MRISDWSSDVCSSDLPPASFERNGQKIRTPGEVLDNGIATCLDSAVLFASALEQIGLRPLIAFTEGHAICGLWLQPQTLPSLITDDPAELRKHIDLKELLLFETTLVTHEPPKKFSKAIETANGEIAEAVEDKFVYALDIARARSEEHTSELQSLMRISYAVFCLKKKTQQN